MPLAAPILIAAKAIPEDLLLSLPVLLGATTGFTSVASRMQFARAVKTAALTHLFREIRIDFGYQLR
jgi:hypothetical protein